MSSLPSTGLTCVAQRLLKIEFRNGPCSNETKADADRCHDQRHESKHTRVDADFLRTWHNQRAKCCEKFDSPINKDKSQSRREHREQQTLNHQLPCDLPTARS